MPIIVSTPTSQRVDRVVNDICSLQHDNSAAARARALRWVAHVLQDANSRRKWWFLEAVVSTVLDAGEDVVELHGDIAKLAAVYCGKRLEQRPLAQLTTLRQEAAKNGAANAGVPGLYAIEHTIDGQRVHLWPAPGASTVLAATADAGTDLVTVSTAPTTGTRVRVGTDGTLPAPLVAGTTYFAIRVSATTLKLATTLANALAGTAIDLTDAGSGSHTLTHGLTPFAVLYTRPMDLAIVPDFWETVVLNGVLGTFGRHFDRDQLGSEPEVFEQRYERQLQRMATPTWDLERVRRFEEQFATEYGNAGSEAGTAVTYTMPASLTGIGYVTIETGDYPLVVS